MSEIDQIKRASRAWDILIKRLALSEYSITYQELGNKLEIHHRAVRFVLAVILDYTNEYELPPITALVVNKTTGKPGQGFIDWYDGKPEDAFQSVRNHDWSNEANPFNDINELGSPNEIVEAILADPDGENQIIAKIESRGLGQRLFRQALLAAYSRKCCVCGLDIPAALEAAHIIPWAIANNTQKSSVRNGLLLCATHHKLYDSKCLGVAKNYEILVDFEVEREGVQEDDPWLFNFDRTKINIPEKPELRPNPAFLEQRHSQDGW